MTLENNSSQTPGYQSLKTTRTSPQSRSRSRSVTPAARDFRLCPSAEQASSLSLPDFLLQRRKYDLQRSDNATVSFANYDRLLRERAVVAKIGRASVIYRANVPLPSDEGTTPYPDEDTIAIKQEFFPLYVEPKFDEMDILLGLEHGHVIYCLGTIFSNQRDSILMLMFPFAAYELQDLMHHVSKSNRQDQHRGQHRDCDCVNMLRKYFSCLSRAVRYLHEKEYPVKHKDIKPQNIVIDRHKNVILTDFGISKEYKKSKVTTSGPDAHTEKYASPQSMQEKERGFDTDIFSLGCVFLEMATLVLGKTLDDLENHLRSGCRETPNYSNCISGAQSWIGFLQKELSENTSRSNVETGFLSALPTISQMIQYDREKRPRIGQVCEAFKDVTGERCLVCDGTPQARPSPPLQRVELDGHTTTGPQLPDKPRQTASHPARRSGELHNHRDLTEVPERISNGTQIRVLRNGRFEIWRLGNGSTIGSLGKELFVFDQSSQNSISVRRTKDVEDAELIHGFLIRLPRLRGATNFHTPSFRTNLWRESSPFSTIKRLSGGIKYFLVKGEYTDQEVEEFRLTGPTEAQ